MRFKIYPSITTTADWRALVAEVKQLGLKEICLFPTAIGYTQRQKLYRLLEQTSVETIPFVHLRSDMDKNEVLYFQNKYKTQLFNIHPQIKGSLILKNDLSEFNSHLYVETISCPLGPEINRYAGICLDPAHMEGQRLLKTKLYGQLMADLEKYPVGFAHISAIAHKTYFNSDVKRRIYDKHTFANLSEFNYLKRYQKYLPEILGLELENSIPEQLEVKKYLEKILAD